MKASPDANSTDWEKLEFLVKELGNNSKAYFNCMLLVILQFSQAARRYFKKPLLTIFCCCY